MQFLILIYENKKQILCINLPVSTGVVIKGLAVF